ncbi:hypothetical protein D3C86_1420240 [compost metagenome]
MIRLMTGETILKRVETESPAQNSIPMVMAAKTRLVPRSGCLKIKRAGKPTTARLERKPSGEWMFLEERTLARLTISPNLAYSEGWILRGPMLSQRWAPRAEWPVRSTAMSMTMVIA